MLRRARAGLAVLACVGLLTPRPAAALELVSTIDLDYTYEQENLGGDVEASATLNQKYELKYTTSLTSAYDFLGAVRVEIEDTADTNDAATSRVSPTLELAAKSSQAAFRVVYEGSISTTEGFRETAETTAYANNIVGEMLMTPAYWPELKLKLERQSEFEAGSADSTTESLELSLKKDFAALRLELDVRSEEVDALMPERTSGRSREWTGKATYKEVLYGGTEFELAYEKLQSAETERTRGVFTGGTESSTQQVKTRLKNSLALTPRLTLGLSWEYQVEQDLLVLDFDYKFSNKYGLDARWDPQDWFKVSGEIKRETETTVNDVGVDDTQKLTDSVRGAVDIEAVSWLRLSLKAELKEGSQIDDGTGGSVDRTSDEKYELVVKNKFGTFWDLTLSGSGDSSYQEGELTKRGSKLKGELRLKYGELGVQPSYEVSRDTDWDTGIEEPASEKQTRDAKLKIEFKFKLLDLLAATFTHEYGFKVEDELDDVLNFERKLQFNENTRINVLLAEILRELKLEGEIERKGSDTEEDADPELVEVSYSLKLNWKLDALSLSSSFEYNDKGDTFDDLIFNTKVDWTGDRLKLTGEYQFDKVLADITEESRKLNLKLSYKF